MYLNYSRHSTKTFLLEVVLFGKEKAFVLSHFFEFVDPCLVVLLVRNGHFDEDRFFFGSVFDDGPVGEDLVIDFRELIILITRVGFLLDRSHYLSILYYQTDIKLQ